MEGRKRQEIPQLNLTSSGDSIEMLVLFSLVADTCCCQLQCFFIVFSTFASECYIVAVLTVGVHYLHVPPVILES